MCSVLSTTTVPLVVDELSDDLCVNYKVNRLSHHEEEWPPNKPLLFVNLALIHYHNKRTQQELNEIYRRSIGGASAIDKLTALHSNVTKDIQKIFTPDGNNIPKRILIEGAPGIGKTVLAKEIAYLWANGEILKEYKLVFLLYFRDPQLHKADSFDKLIEIFIPKITTELKEYITESHGRNVAFVFDGFDEYPADQQEDSFITKMIKSENNVFRNSLILVTSRPTATLSLHHIVDRRIEIIGFPKEERDKYVLLSLENSPDKKHELDKYLEKHAVIDNLCYIPLYLAILVYLFKQGNLPKTLTEINESFILNTIHRYLDKFALSPSCVVKKIKHLPMVIFNFICQLAQLAFKGLRSSQLVFTHEEIKEVYPEVDDIPGAINGFGLLQAVQHYPNRGAGKTTSVHFLHLTMQEYLAAFHVSNLLDEEQSSLMKEIFWDGQFNFMWMMYVGIVGVRSTVFLDFIADKSSTQDNVQINNSIQRDKTKCLHLFQCYMEANISNEMPKAISSVFSDGNIILTGIKLLSHHISSLLFFMSNSSMQRWKALELANCTLGDVGMNSLLDGFSKNQNESLSLEYVDLSGNQSSPWGVYCAIIRYCSAASLTLCGDKEMKAYVEEITDSLQSNTILQSLTLCKIGRKGLQPIKAVYGCNTTLKKINLSWNDMTRTKINDVTSILIQNKVTFSKHNYRVLDINILYSDNPESLPKNIDVSSKDINDDAVCLIAFGLQNNTTVEKLDLSCNKITDDGVCDICNSLKHNNTLKELNLSQNKMTIRGATNISQSLANNSTLQKLDLSQTKITDDEVVMIAKSIQYNTSLKMLSLAHNDITDSGAEALHMCLMVNTTLQELNLSQTKITNNGVEIIAKSIAYATSLQVLNLSHNNITKRGAKTLSDCLKVNTTLKELDLSHNDITNDGAMMIALSIKKNTSLQMLNLSHNNFTDWGAEMISNCLMMNTTLKELDLSHNNITDYGAMMIAQSIERNTFLQVLNLSHNNITDYGAKKIFVSLTVKNTLKELDLSQNNITDDGTKMISLSIIYNTSLQMLNLSHNKITDYGAENIFKSLTVNTTLKELNLSQNNITVDRAMMFTESIQHNKLLKIKT